MLSRLTRVIAGLKRAGARHVLIGCGIGLGLVVAVVTGSLVAMARRNDMRGAQRELENIAFLLSEETERSFAGAQLAEADLLAALRKEGIDTPRQFITALAGREVHLDLQRRVAGLRQASNMVLISRYGRVVNMSRAWPVPESDASKRDFFLALSKDSGPDAYISAPFRGARGVAILLAHAFRSPAGELIGVVAVTMERRRFERLFASISIGPGSSVALWRDDGMLLARFPPYRTLPAGLDDGPMRGFWQAAGMLGRDLVIHVSPIDGMTRLAAPRGVPGFPLMLAVTKTVDAVTAEWRPLAFWVISGTALTELVLAAIVVLGVRRLRDQEQLAAAHATTVRAEAARAVAESELERARERVRSDEATRIQALRFNTALDNMLQGLAMFDGQRRLLVVNRRFSVLFGLPPEVLCHGMTHDAFVQALVDHGNLPAADLAAVIARRRRAIAANQRLVTVTEWSDGRVFSVIHQPMEEGWLATYEDISDRRRAEERLAHMTRHDPLTDLPNRLCFHEMLEHALAFARRGRLVGLLCLDLDQFKAVNDTLGHTVGDALLQAVARRLSAQIRDIDVLARLGGDEFGIIQTVIEKPSDAAGLAARLIDVLDAPFVIGEHQLAINTSIGIAFAPQDGLDADALLKNAELGLYRAKTDGRRTYRLFQARMDTEMQARRAMEIELRAALQGDEFDLFYQPLIGVASRSVSGFEALLRWRHPTRGLVSPGAFIGLAEETGLIVPIGAWALRRACAAAARWPDHIRLAVNLSPVQFAHPGIVQTVVAALREAGLAPERLELEITESTMMADTTATLAILHEFRALGTHIAMDDFGTGYSSLSYLRRFPFDRIKIDQLFVRELGRQKDCDAIVRAVTELSRDLGIAITAEGVETKEQMRMLVIAGCTDLQGYLFSPPVAEQEIVGLLGVLGEMDELMPPVGLVA